MAGNGGKGIDGAPPTHVHIERKEAKRLAWTLLALGVLAALLALSRCNHGAATATTTATTNTVVAQAPTAPTKAALAGTSGLGTYLAGSQPTPQTLPSKSSTSTSRKATFALPIRRSRADLALDDYGKPPGEGELQC